jgi:hypothetical protein
LERVKGMNMGILCAGPGLDGFIWNGRYGTKGRKKKVIAVWSLGYFFCLVIHVMQGDDLHLWGLEKTLTSPVFLVSAYPISPLTIEMRSVHIHVLVSYPR